MFYFLFVCVAATCGRSLLQPCYPSPSPLLHFKFIFSPLQPGSPPANPPLQFEFKIPSFELSIQFTDHPPAELTSASSSNTNLNSIFEQAEAGPSSSPSLLLLPFFFLSLLFFSFLFLSTPLIFLSPPVPHHHRTTYSF